MYAAIRRMKAKPGFIDEVVHWAIRDDLGMLQQLGVIPTPSQVS